MFEGWGAAAAAAAVVGGVVESNNASKAASTAANAQQAESQAGLSAQQQQFNSIQALLAPYVQGGTAAFGQQQDLAGVNGNSAQQSAISALQASPAFTSAQQLGTTSILQNAAATGGLRGGNTQGALAQFSPQLLASTINDKFNQLGAISQQGLGAATQTGSFGQASTNNVTSLLGQIGASQAGNALAQGNAQNGYANAISNGLGTYVGLGGLRGNTAAPAYQQAGGYQYATGGNGTGAYAVNGTTVANNPSAYVADGGP